VPIKDLQPNFRAVEQEHVDKERKLELETK